MTFGNDYSAPNGAIVERRAYGVEVAGETRVIRLETVRAMEAELARVEVRVDFRVVGPRNLKFTCPYQPRYEFVAC
jgi:hypothetical protein